MPGVWLRLNHTCRGGLALAIESLVTITIILKILTITIVIVMVRTKVLVVIVVVLIVIKNIRNLTTETDNTNADNIR